MIDEETRRAQMIEAVNTIIIQNGFADLTMNKIAHIMGVSRAKLYQYFPSKDAVVNAVVDRYFTFMDRQQLPASNSASEFVTTFPEVFFQIVMLVASTSEAFKTDLDRLMQDRSQALMERYNNWMAHVQAFIRAGQDAGAFNESVMPELFCIQIESIVPTLMSQERVVQYRLDVATILPDYLKMVIAQVIRPEWLEQLELNQFQPRIADLTAKYKQTLLRM